MMRLSTKAWHAIIFTIVLCLLAIRLYLDKDIIFVPNSDFLNYLSVGSKMFKNPIDPTITTVPLYGIISYIFELFVPTRYPGIYGTILFNIVCFMLTLYYIWKISFDYLGSYSILPVLFLASNYLIRFVVLQPSNLPLTLLCVIVSIYFFEKKPAVSYGIALLGVLTRIDVLVYFISLFIIDKIQHRKIRCSPWILLISFLAIAWIIRPVIPHDNYLDEIKFRKSELPNIAFVRNSVLNGPFSNNMLISHQNIHWNSLESILWISSLIWISVGAFYSVKYRIKNSHLMIIFILGYTFIHVIFPDSVLRYSYPLLPFVYILILWPIILLKTQIDKRISLVIWCLVCVISLLLLYCNLSRGPEYIEDQRWDRSERRFISEWLNANISEESNIYTFEYYVYDYYISNSNIVLQDTTKKVTWKNTLCSDPHPQYIIFDNQTDKPGSYFDHLNGQDFFLKIQASEKMMKELKLVKSIQIKNRHADVYLFPKLSENWCSTFFE